MVSPPSSALFPAFLMPDCDRFRGGPSRAVHGTFVGPGERSKVFVCVGEDYSEFLICMDRLKPP